MVPHQWRGYAGLVAIGLVAFVMGLLLGSNLERERWEDEWRARESYEERLREVNEEQDQAAIDDEEDVGEGSAPTVALEIDWAVSDKAEAADAKFLAALKDRAYTGDTAKGSVMYRLGTVTGDAYAGNTLYMLVFEAVGMGPSYEYYYLLTDYGSSSQVTLMNSLAGHQGSFSENSTAEEKMGDDFERAGFVDVKVATPVQLGTVVTVDRDVYIPELMERDAGDIVHVSDPIENVYGKGIHDLVVLGAGSRSETRPETGDFVSRFADDTFLYKQTTGQLQNLYFSIRNDGRYEWYDVVIPFWESGENFFQSAVPEIVWEDGTVNTASYMKGEAGGCGYATLTKVVDKEELGTLVPIGTASSGGKVYGQQDTNSERLSDAFRSWAIQHQDKTYTQFLAERPFFYYEDSFGRWIEFTNTQVMPPSECGKPVIYLYPETTQDITVQVAPKGGFTKTEPAYGNGWRVTATPEGVLTNAADGKIYPYLFWEGRGGMYEEPRNYWVVAKNDVPAFLTSTLGKLGLNQKEIADFNEFWLPRMTSANYYKIGFHGTNVMNQIAPMKLSQKADATIRILMDYSPLQAPIAAKPPTLPKTPVRTGFTVIEWGGVIR